MHTEQTEIDLTYAKSPLFVRQTVAVALGIPIDREFTWSILLNLATNSTNTTLPKFVLVRGLFNLALILPDEKRMFLSFLRDIKVLYPDIIIEIVIHG
jgi:hypothetical protein